MARSCLRERLRTSFLDPGSVPACCAPAPAPAPAPALALALALALDFVFAFAFAFAAPIGWCPYGCGPIKFEPLALSLSKGFDRLSLNGYLDFKGPDQ